MLYPLTTLAVNVFKYTASVENRVAKKFLAAMQSCPWFRALKRLHAIDTHIDHFRGDIYCTYNLVL